MVDYDLGKVVGDKGETGNGIASITLYSTSGKVKTYRITYTDGSTFDFQVRDGNDASVTVDSSLSSTSTNPVQNKIINSALNGKASSSHSHSISDVSSLQSSLDGKSDTGHTHTKSNITDFAHTHDDRYYTESETDNLLSGKANTSHTHTKSQITDFPSIPSKISDLTNDSDFIEKSSTSGLVKNDGTIDTNTYLTQHQDISGKVNTSDVVNNLTTTTAGKVLDARQGKVLADLIGDAITYINS